MKARDSKQAQIETLSVQINELTRVTEAFLINLDPQQMNMQDGINALKYLKEAQAFRTDLITAVEEDGQTGKPLDALEAFNAETAIIAKKGR